MKGKDKHKRIMSHLMDLLKRRCHVWYGLFWLVWLVLCLNKCWSDNGFRNSVDATLLYANYLFSLTTNSFLILVLHCKDTIPRNSNQICPEKELRTTTVPIPTFMFLWAIYIFPRLVCLFCCRKIGGPIVGIYRSINTWMWKLGLRALNSFSGNT